MNKTYHIIIVEEDEAVFKMIVEALEKTGSQFHARCVASQEELDEELLQLEPDFVLCDHSREKWNSFAVLERVRAFRSTMPFAVISGGLDEGTHATLLASGVDACVDRNRLAELAPAVRMMLLRRVVQERRCVDEIRRNIIPIESLRLRPVRRAWQARTA